MSYQRFFLPPNNPTTYQRHQLFKQALLDVNRLEDYNNIIDLLSPPQDITKLAAPGVFKGIKVGIIGGGLAGLAAAFELRKLGFDITIFDALKDRVGGRVYTYYFNKSKELYGELGPMRIPISHESTWHYIDLFNLNTRPFIQNNENAFIYVGDLRVRNDPLGRNVMKKIYPMFKLRGLERRTPWQKLLSYGLTTTLSRIPPRIRREILKIKKHYHPLIKYWTSFNERQVLEKMNLSQGAISMLGSVSPFVEDFFYYSYSEVLQEEYTVAYSFLYEIIGGLAKLPISFYKSLTSNTPTEYDNIPTNRLGKITWKSDHLITEISQNPEKNQVILKYNNNLSSNTIESFDYIICAIPFSSLRLVTVDPLFSTMKMVAIRDLGYSNSQKTVLLCKNRFWEEGGENNRIIGGGSYTDLPITSIWYPSDHARCIYNNKCSPKESGVLLASYNFTLDAVRLGNLIKPRRIEEIKRQVESVHGLPRGYLDNIVKDYKSVNWNEQSEFYGAFAYFQPEQKRIYSSTIIRPEYNNKVFFAGEHTSATHAWMQGALRSGMRAANQLAKSCKLNNKL
ncbi:flavin monoamine oxidase family protein [Orenia marismortui]|uniref:Monoamine oxidase n=1 Tax=Orenia marismortui TaxID=46469 RepID=A0A4R8GRF1_9FIRM|nr:NAD(P)/FAD-dependent oxidoreductase [Orenia marismortui]TDX48453.1 monoamine oxidase [Orenia marismortui]